MTQKKQVEGAAIFQSDWDVILPYMLEEPVDPPEGLENVKRPIGALTVAYDPARSKAWVTRLTSEKLTDPQPVQAIGETELEAFTALADELRRREDES